MTLAIYGILRTARQYMSDGEAATAARLAEAGDAGDEAALDGLMDMCRRVLTRERIRQAALDEQRAKQRRAGARRAGDERANVLAARNLL